MIEVAEGGAWPIIDTISRSDYIEGLEAALKPGLDLLRRSDRHFSIVEGTTYMNLGTPSIDLRWGYAIGGEGTLSAKNRITKDFEARVALFLCSLEKEGLHFFFRQGLDIYNAENFDTGVKSVRCHMRIVKVKLSDVTLEQLHYELRAGTVILIGDEDDDI